MSPKSDFKGENTVKMSVLIGVLNNFLKWKMRNQNGMEV